MQRKKTGAFRDLVIISIVATGVFMSATVFDVVGLTFEWSQQYENRQFDELKNLNRTEQFPPLLSLS